MGHVRLKAFPGSCKPVPLFDTPYRNRYFLAASAEAKRAD
jgi:hypothetical protein